MAKKDIVAPYFTDEQRRIQRVMTTQVQAALPWPAYYKYRYLGGVGFKLQRIPRHLCGLAGSALEQLKRTQRLINFMDSTGCTPLAVASRPSSHAGVAKLSDSDHLTWWLGAHGEPLALIEPYTALDDLLSEIAARELTAYVLPAPGIYGGGGGQTTSVLIAPPENSPYLRQLSVIEWHKPLGNVQDINWLEALNLGKERSI